MDWIPVAGWHGSGFHGTEYMPWLHRVGYLDDVRNFLILVAACVLRGSSAAGSKEMWWRTFCICGQGIRDDAGSGRWRR